VDINMGLAVTVSLFQPRQTVTPASGFSAANDGVALREAMKGFGTDEQAIIDILTHRSNSQRQQIAKFFTEEYGRVSNYLY
jgi:hypothetical protein